MNSHLFYFCDFRRSLSFALIQASIVLCKLSSFASTGAPALDLHLEKHLQTQLDLKPHSMEYRQSKIGVLFFGPKIGGTMMLSAGWQVVVAPSTAAILPLAVYRFELLVQAEADLR